MEHERDEELESSAKQAVEKLIESDANILNLTGIQVVNIGPRSVVLRMSVTDKMVNSQRVCHGGFLFLLADTAFAYGLAASGLTPITLQASISYIRGARLGETVTAHASVNHAGAKAGFCDIRVENESGKLVCSFQATGLNHSA